MFMPKTGANDDLKNSLYRQLKQSLVYCRYQPGSMLNETSLASEYGASRTPIREALTRLEQDGLVEILPKRGIRVTTITFQNIFHVFQIRQDIEPLTMRMALPYIEKSKLEYYLETFRQPASDIDTAFWEDIEMHMYFVRHCGNPFYIKLMDTVFAQSTRISIASHQNKEKLDQARAEHVAILEALLAGESEKAGDLLKNHLKNCLDYTVNYFNVQSAKEKHDENWNVVPGITAEKR